MSADWLAKRFNNDAGISAKIREAVLRDFRKARDADDKPLKFSSFG